MPELLPQNAVVGEPIPAGAKVGQQQPASGGDAQPSLTNRIAAGALTAPIDPGTEEFASKHPYLGVPVRALSSAGGAMIGLPGSIYHSFADPLTPQEQQNFQGHTRIPGEVALERLSGAEGAPEALNFWRGKSDIKPTVGGAVSVMPELTGQAIGTAAGAELGGQLISGAAAAKPYIKPVGEALAKGYAKKLVPQEAITAYKAVKAAQPGAPVQGEVLPPDVYNPGYRAPRAYSPGPTAQPIPSRPGLMLQGEVAPSPESGALKGVGSPAQPPRGLEQARSLSTVQPKPVEAKPTVAKPPSPYEGVDELRGKLTSGKAIETRAKDLPKPAPAAKPVAAKAEAEAASPGERVTKASDIAKIEAPKAKPVEAKTAAARREDYIFGEHAKGYDPENILHRKIKDMTHEELAQAANERKLDGRTNWSKSDFSRNVAEHGKHSSTNAKRVRGMLLDEAGR